MTSKTGEDPGSGPQALPLDDVDRAIVAVLREDGRISMRALAARLHISRSGAYLRVQRLEEAGVITGYSAWVDPQRYGYGLSAYVHSKITAAWRLATCFRRLRADRYTPDRPVRDVAAGRCAVDHIT